MVDRWNLTEILE